MKKASVSELKNQLSALVGQARRGRTILITDHGVPAARLMPPLGVASSGKDRLAHLERNGLVRRGRGRRLERILNEEPAPVDGDIDVQTRWNDARRDRT